MVKQIGEKCDISRHLCHSQLSQEREQLQDSDSLSQSKTLIRGADDGGMIGVTDFRGLKVHRVKDRIQTRSKSGGGGWSNSCNRVSGDGNGSDRSGGRDNGNGNGSGDESDAGSGDDMVRVVVMAVVMVVLMLMVMMVMVVVGGGGGGRNGGGDGSGDSVGGSGCRSGGGMVVMVIMVMVIVAVMVADHGGGWLDNPSDSGYAPLDYVRGSYMLHKLADSCSRCGPALRSVETVTGMPLWCKDFAEHRNANSRLTKSGLSGEPTLYPAVTLSDYKMCDNRHPLLELRSHKCCPGYINS
ncbi:hypothetical protein PoB_004385400 [Plakobranchus ocellatus]|uniref:Uncharacterized protein n=1 Tax=Plakobranchus ocellatus TaxID=259542 RepID=A0AAV4BEU4_9GAST|nr:hypothetical protein PoB_004385400 [Plakobranchus ocellatus]